VEGEVFDPEEVLAVGDCGGDAEGKEVFISVAKLSYKIF